jgi:hypothetical protein
MGSRKFVLAIITLVVLVDFAVYPISIGYSIGKERYTMTAIIPGYLYFLFAETSNGPMRGILGPSDSISIVNSLRRRPEATLVYGASCEVEVRYIYVSRVYTGTLSYQSFATVWQILRDWKEDM